MSNNNQNILIMYTLFASFCLKTDFFRLKYHPYPFFLTQMPSFLFIYSACTCQGLTRSYTLLDVGIQEQSKLIAERTQRFISMSKGRKQCVKERRYNFRQRQVISKCDLDKGGQGSMWIFGENISDKTFPGLDHVPGVLERQPYSSQRLRRQPTWPKKFSVKLGSAVRGCNAHLVPSVVHSTVGAGITVQSYFSIPRQLKSVLTGGSFYRFPFFSQHTFLPLLLLHIVGRTFTTRSSLQLPPLTPPPRRDSAFFRKKLKKQIGRKAEQA